MADKTLGIEPKLYEYLQLVSVREPSILKELRQETANHPMARMQIAPEQGQLLALLVQLIGAEKTLELGVFKGYSSLAVALAIPEKGKVIACDISEEYTAIARHYWDKAGVSHKIDLRIAPALETLDKLMAEGQSNTFDFAFIDADKSNYDSYYEQVLKLVRPGGLIAIDNVLWGGKVADKNIQDNLTKKMRALNEKIYKDSRVNISLIPIADGLTLLLKR
ncbi:MAG: class I SAM-dependent methyltransferase [cyanobacterium endosymbiont of Rhopalodia musculus]|uniref:class I SAM-dependent methyltransferase n=1 Tax=cyanobacterium endosymbiont of Epithemia clementina EcSB TaxID=3034674 RepID=UPI00247FC732|nr:class I SAM-dependent methyltransferase [cyanobacterium endosymbiont of Epithemia clementina EcSB]WGT68187.1 class I SAM-dependent methyltransferase [cyanobacterium endosymbiont of Epithemia clementina EcSB]